MDKSLRNKKIEALNGPKGNTACSDQLGQDLKDNKPTQADYDAVLQFAKPMVLRYGRDALWHEDADQRVRFRGRNGVSRQHAHVPASRTFYEPEREPTTSLSFPLRHLSGMDNYSNPHPLLVKKSDYAKANGFAPEAVVTHANRTRCPLLCFMWTAPAPLA